MGHDHLAGVDVGGAQESIGGLEAESSSALFSHTTGVADDPLHGNSPCAGEGGIGEKVDVIGDRQAHVALHERVAGHRNRETTQVVFGGAEFHRLHLEIVAKVLSGGH